MPLDLPHFPSAVDQLRERVARERHLTPTQRIHAVCDVSDAVERLSRSSSIREWQLEYWENQENEWQRIMKEFIAQHVQS
ncbi:MAG: hypothetical protein QGF00_08255 [Planctomycetota bacterium]|jgi:hypothetical protein|nr:hypothetical protein [Planctomycetota bacterium]MDP7249579.1 hypothetical protein [Planctomycetota bacterium]